MSPLRHENIAPLLSAFLDGELTQADSQRVRLHLEDCPECRAQLDQLAGLQRLTAAIAFPAPDDRLDNLAARLSVRGPRRLGWIVLAVGLAAWIVYAVVLAIMNLRPPTVAELLGGALVLGIVLLFLSVVRQRYLEYHTDRYRRVKR